MNLELFFSISTCIYLAGAAYFDYKTKKVPNRYNKYFFLASLLLVSLKSFWGFNYLLDSLTGMLLGFSILFIPFVFKFGGAGDVKVLSICGLLLGTKSLLSIVFLSFVYKAGIFIPLVSGRAIFLSFLTPFPLKDKLLNSFYLLKNNYIAYVPFLFLASCTYLICQVFFPEVLDKILS